MAQEPPNNIPRIAKVLNPSSGHYVVLVRMPQLLASKYPDKPFLTRLDGIGLSKKDSDQHPDFVFIESVEMKGSPDLLWAFQKLDGPIWTTKSLGIDSLVPAKYRRQIAMLKTEQEVFPDTEPSPLVGDLTNSIVEQVKDSGKAVRINTQETINLAAPALLGQQFAPDGTLLATAELLVTEGTDADKNVLVAQSSVSPLGNGKSIKDTSKARRRTISNTTEDGWPIKQTKTIGQESLIPPKFRGQVVSVRNTEQVELLAVNVSSIPDPSTLSGDEILIEHEKVNDYRYEKRTSLEVIDENATPFVSHSVEDQEYITTEVLVLEGDEADSGAGVVSSEVKSIGRGKAIKTTRFAVSSFTSPDTWTVGYATMVDQTVGEQGVIPAKFRSLSVLKVWRTKVDSPSSPLLPDLGVGLGDYSGYTILEKAVKQVRSQDLDNVWEVVIVGISGTTESLVSYEVGEGAERATVTESLLGEIPDPLPSDSATVKYELMALGNGMYVQVTRAQAVFSNATYSHEQTIQVPREFLIITDQVTESVVEEGISATPDPLGVENLGVVTASANRVDAYRVQKQKTTVNGTKASSVTEKLTDGNKLVVTRTKTHGDETVDTPSALKTVQSKALGDNLYENIIDTIPSVFPSTAVSRQQPSSIPSKFVITEESTSSVIAGTTATPEALGTLGAGVVSSSSQRIDAFTLKTDKTERTISTAALAGQRFAPDGTTLATSEAIVADGSLTEKGLNIAQSEVTPIGNGRFIKDVVTAKRRTVLDATEDGWPIKQKKSKGIESLTPQKYRGQTTTSITTEQIELLAANVSSIPTPPSPVSPEIVIEHEKVNDYRYEKRVTTEVIDEDADPLEGNVTDTWGINTTEESLVVDGSPVDYGFGLKSSSVSPLGNGKSIKQTESYPTPILSAGIVYKLEAQTTDDKTGIILDVDRELVDAASAKTLAIARRADGWYPDLQPLDKWHTIMISTKVFALPAAETWNETMEIRLPNYLEEVGVIWDIKEDTSGAGASGTDDNAVIESKKIKWGVSAEAMVTGSITGRPYTKVKAGVSGAANVSVTRTYSFGPPTDLIAEHIFRPSYGMILINGSQGQHTSEASQTGVGAVRVDHSLKFRSSYDDSLTVHDFGPVEHNNPVLTFLGDSSLATPTVTISQSATTGSLPGSGFYPVAEARLNLLAKVEVKMPESSTPLVAGDTYIAKVVVSEWGFGIWVREVYTVTVP